MPCVHSVCLHLARTGQGFPFPHRVLKCGCKAHICLVPVCHVSGDHHALGDACTTELGTPFLKTPESGPQCPWVCEIRSSLRTHVTPSAQESELMGLPVSL